MCIYGELPQKETPPFCGSFYFIIASISHSLIQI